MGEVTAFSSAHLLLRDGCGWRFYSNLYRQKRLNRLSNRQVQQGDIHRKSLAVYWSATENNNNNAWNQRMSDGNQNNNNKNTAYLVRCVRKY